MLQILFTLYHNSHLVIYEPQGVNLFAYYLFKSKNRFEESQKASVCGY